MTTSLSPSPIQPEIDALVAKAMQSGIDRKTLIRMLQQRIVDSTETITKPAPLIDMRSAQEIVLSDPKRATAVNKLLTFIGEIEYQRERGGAAVPVMTWMERNIIDSGRMTREELLLVPMFVFSDGNPRLYQALMNFERPTSR